MEPVVGVFVAILAMASLLGIVVALPFALVALRRTPWVDALLQRPAMRKFTHALCVLCGTEGVDLINTHQLQGMTNGGTVTVSDIEQGQMPAPRKVRLSFPRAKYVPPPPPAAGAGAAKAAVAAAAAEPTSAEAGEGAQGDALTAAAPCCAICYELFEAGQQITTLPCNGSTQHFFHSPCIDRWLQRDGSCPQCRTDFHPQRLAKAKAPAALAAAATPAEAGAKAFPGGLVGEEGSVAGGSTTSSRIPAGRAEELSQCGGAASSSSSSSRPAGVDRHLEDASGGADVAQVNDQGGSPAACAAEPAASAGAVKGAAQSSGVGNSSSPAAAAVP